MNKRVELLVEEVRKLSLSEREELLKRLHLDLDGADSDERPEAIEAAWAEEVKRRIEMAERGETVSLPHEQVLAELREIARRS